MGVLECRHASGRTVHPLAIQVMFERGVDLKKQLPKLVEAVPPVDVFVTVCANAAADCPLTPPGAHVEHWNLPDPADATGTPEEVLQVFRESRDDIERRVRTLLDQRARDAS